MGKRTKIDWADATWNPVTGCRHGCEYCYARRMIHRVCGKAIMPGEALNVLDAPWRRDEGEPIRPYPFGFTPTFHRYRLDEIQKWAQPRSIFVCSMADLFGEWVPDEWIRQVFEACKAAPKHRYLFLTKNPLRYGALWEQGIILPNTIDWWYGYTIDGTKPVPRNAPIGSRVFISIEPILRRPDGAMLDDIAKVSWVIVGAESGNRKGKVKPKREWIEAILRRCRDEGIPVLMKESLRELMGDDFTQEYPWEAREHEQDG